MKFPDSDRRRFFSKVRRDDVTGCLLWTGAKYSNGYGAFRLAGVVRYAHRVAWVLAGNRLTAAKPQICHHCDVRACCEPSHLYAGTSADNGADMARRKRGTQSALGWPYGVSPHGRGYMARVQRNGQQIYLGTHDTIEEAAAVAERARAL